METTPCGLLKFNQNDTYNFSDAVSNFKREDELLAQLGAHESRVFVYSSVAAAGGTVDPAWTVIGFTLRGVGEWFYLSVIATPKSNIARNSGSSKIVNLPARFAAMHTQKLTSVTTGRGARGWISSAGQIHLGVTSGTDANITTGESIQLAGWYLPINTLETIGIPSIGEKSPFFSSYLSTLSIVDKACELAKTNLTRDTKDAYLIVKGNNAYQGERLVFSVDSANFTINSVRFTEYGDFAFIGLNVSSKKVLPIGADGKITPVRLGTLMHYGFRPYNSQSIEPANVGRINYCHINSDSEIKMTAVGRAGTASGLSIGITEAVSVAGYYRLAEAS